MVLRFSVTTPSSVCSVKCGHPGFPDEVVESIRDSVDCNLYFFENKVGTGAMFLILGGSIAFLIALYVLFNAVSRRRN